MAAKRNVASTQASTMSKMCCNCNKIMALAIIVLLWIPALVSASLWVKIVISLLALFMGLGNGMCMACNIKNK
jgi:hypothetical protein